MIGRLMTRFEGQWRYLLEEKVSNLEVLSSPHIYPLLI